MMQTLAFPKNAESEIQRMLNRFVCQVPSQIQALSNECLFAAHC